MAVHELAANERATSFRICPRCGLSIKPRAGWLTVEYCPRCIARARIPVRLSTTPLPSSELDRDGFEPNTGNDGQSAARRDRDR
jgi:hypothetical protein